MKIEIILLLLAGLPVPEIARRTNACAANVRWYKRELAAAQARLMAKQQPRTPKGWLKK